MTLMVDKLLRNYPIISAMVSVPELRVILSELEAVLCSNVDGDIVEFGCNVGTTSLFIQRMLLEAASTKRFYCYDSFEGLPDKSVNDNPTGIPKLVYNKGTCLTGLINFNSSFTTANLPLPIVKQSWFSNLKEEDLPSKIAFAFFDGDFYESILDSFRKTINKLHKGSVVVLHDYENGDLPGVKRATGDFLDQLSSTQYKLRSNSGLGILTIL